jgi:hypothetical protein
MAPFSTFSLSLVDAAYGETLGPARDLTSLTWLWVLRFACAVIVSLLLGSVPMGGTPAFSSQQESNQSDRTEETDRTGETDRAANASDEPALPPPRLPPPLTEGSGNEVFSGPQPGEPLTGFPVRIVFGGEAGKEIDLVSEAGPSPVVLLFVHEVTRPSIAVMRAITRYAVSRAGDGLHVGVIFLTADATETEAFLRRAHHALPPDVVIGISLDGLEGPGEYGLNRHVSLSILIGKGGETTGNFALVQPSLQTDVLRVVRSIMEVLESGSLPPLAQLIGESEPMDRVARAPVAGDVSENQIRSLLQPLIRRNASPDEVERVAAAVQQKLEANEALRNRIGAIATNIVRSDKLTNYGSPAAQEVLARWARMYGPTDSP